MISISRYWFLDWVGMALGFLAMWQLGNRDRRGFIPFMMSNVIWVVIGVWVSSLAMVLGNALFLGINLRGWFRWSEEARRSEPASPAPGA